MRAAIFDLDGTLADSVPDIAASLNAALAGEGLAPFEVEAVTGMVGAGARTLVERALSARGASRSKTHDVWTRFVAHYDRHPCVATVLYPGAREALEQLAREGWKLAVCTNKPEEIAVQVIEALGIAHLFGAVVGGRDGVALKPAPDMVRLTLEILGVPPSRAIFIGDSAADVGAACAAAIPVIVMGHGYRGGEPAGALGADMVAIDFTALISAISTIQHAERA